MSEEELRYNLDLLECLCKYGQEALIEADKIEYLKADGSWESLDELGLSLVPILIYTKRHRDLKKSSIIYELNYKLLIPNINIVPYYLEQVEFNSNHQLENPYIKRYYRKENTCRYQCTVRYDNSNINTFSKVKSSATMSSFKKNNKNLLVSLANKINSPKVSSFAKQKVIK